MSSLPISKIARSGKTLKELLIEQVKAEKIEKRYVGYIVDVPFTTSTRKHVKFKQSTYDHVALTIIDTESYVDATEYFYKLRFNDKCKLFFNAHEAIYSFYDWYVKQVANKQNRLIQLPEIQRNKFLHYFELLHLFNILFNIHNYRYQKFLSYTDIGEKLNMLKDIIVNPDPYLQLYTSDL